MKFQAFPDNIEFLPVLLDAKSLMKILLGGSLSACALEY
jgi:hypothetical protein